jgi:ABC-type ATPase involved in cell division
VQVVATHDLHLVRESGLRQIVIENGRIAASEPEGALPVIEARR